MAGVTLKQLNAVRKSMEAIFTEDDAELETIGKQFDGLEAAIRKGESVSAEDLSDILGEVVVEKAVETPAVEADNGDGEMQDPIQPIMVGLYKAVFGEDGKIRKSVDPQALFQKAYEDVLGQLDGAIEGAVEATSIELGKGAQVDLGKGRVAKRKGHKPGCDDPDCDGDCMGGGGGGDGEDMEKLLKAAGVSPAVIRKLNEQGEEIRKLRTERDLERFEKQADDIGEGKAFGAQLLKLHQLDPKLAGEIQKRLQTKNALLRKGNQWAAEIGGGAAGDGSPDAYAQLDAHAKEMIEKGEKDARGQKLTVAKAFTEACNRFPDLYREYQAERARRVG